MSLNVNDFPIQNGDLINGDNEVVNIVDLLGGTPVSNQTVNKNDYPIKSGLVIGSDNKVYDITESLGNVKDDIEQLQDDVEALSSATLWKGVTTTPLVDKATTSPIELNGESVVPENGWVVEYNSLEFAWNGSCWEQYGASSYDQLTNRPSINGVTLTGNKTSSDLGIITESEVKNIAGNEVNFDAKLPVYEEIENKYSTNTLLFVEGIEGYTQSVSITIDPVQSARVNWGDGSNLDFITEETTLTHTYEKEGKYIIKIESPSGRVYILSGNAIVLTNCNLIKTQFGADCNVRNSLSFPAQNLTDLYAKGQADFDFSIFRNTKLKEFYINNIDSSVTIPNDSFRYSTIEKITISDNFKTFGNRVFPNYIKEIHIETDPSNPHINFTFNEYTFANISEYTPVYIPYGTKTYFETNLSYFKTYIEVVNDVAVELHKKLDSTGDTLENENFYLGRDNISFTTQRNFEVESDNGGELSVNNGVDMTSTDGSTLNVGRNIAATADGNVVLTSGDNSSITLSDDVDITAYASLNLTYDSGESLTVTEGSTNVFSIDDNGISTTKDITTTNTTFGNTSLVTKQWVLNNSSSDVICTQAEYNALPSSKLTDGVSYYITDVNVVGDGNNISW